MAFEGATPRSVRARLAALEAENRVLRKRRGDGAIRTAAERALTVLDIGAPNAASQVIRILREALKEGDE